MKAINVFNKISVLFENYDLTEQKSMRNYGNYVCKLLDEEESHGVSLLLHTGSLYYDVITIVVAVLKVLFEKNTGMKELLLSLREGEKLIVDQQRAKFLGIKAGSLCGMGANVDKKYFCYEVGGGLINYIPVELIRGHDIFRYQGTASGLGRKGVRGSFDKRKKFIGEFCGFVDQKEVSPEIDSSIAVIAEPGFAERVYKKVVISYQNKKVRLSELVTASYFSDNDQRYQFGDNPSKEDDIIKFYSKTSSCREGIIRDNGKKISICIVCDEKNWVSNSEIHDIVDRSSLRFSLLLGRTHYTEYRNWISDERYKLCALVPEIVKQIISRYTNPSDGNFDYELKRWESHHISSFLVESNCSAESGSKLKHDFLKIKNGCFSSELKEAFLISGYFLYNLCRSSFFPLKYCDKAFEENIIPWKISDKLNQMVPFIETQTGEMKFIAENIRDKLKTMVDELYHENPKGNHLLARLMNDRPECIVSPKAYYQSLVRLWLTDVGFEYETMPEVITADGFRSAEQFYENILFASPFMGLSFNPYAELNFISGEVMCYAYEIVNARVSERAARSGQRQIRDRNLFGYDLQLPADDIVAVTQVEESLPSNDEPTDDFETEMERLAKDLQFKSAKKYMSDVCNPGDGTVQIAKIVGFVSGAVGFFTKYYKAYVLKNELIEEVGQEELKPGDKIVFTKETENKDIVDIILNKLFETTFRENHDLLNKLKLSKYWKAELKNYMNSCGVSYRELAQKLKRAGCQKHEVTVRSWLHDESHVVGPFDVDDYEAMSRVVRFEYSAADIKGACDFIRSLRRKILKLLSDAIIRRMTSEASDPAWDSVLQNAESLSQIEQIASIDTAEEKRYIPLNMANKPINI